MVCTAEKPRKKSVRREKVGRCEGRDGWSVRGRESFFFHPSIIDHYLIPPEIPYVSQAVYVSTDLFKAAKSHYAL